MELWKEILKRGLEDNSFKETSKDNIVDFIETKSYCALVEIKKIIEDNSLDDKECFMKIEEIICLFENIGSNGGSRHDF